MISWSRVFRKRSGKYHSRLVQIPWTIVTFSFSTELCLLSLESYSDILIIYLYIHSKDHCESIYVLNTYLLHILTHSHVRLQFWNKFIHRIYSINIESLHIQMHVRLGRLKLIAKSDFHIVIFIWLHISFPLMSMGDQIGCALWYF